MNSYKPAFIMRDDSLTVVIDFQQYAVPKSDARYQKLIELSKRVAKGLPVCIDAWKDAVTVKAVEAPVAKTQVSQSVSVPGGYEDVIKVNSLTGEVTVGGEIVHNTVTKRIQDFVLNGLPFEPLVNFLRKLRRNPSYKAQVQLLNFLENRSLPITEDGDFLGYKAVREDFKDKHSGTFDNSPGQTPRMKRSDVDDDNRNQCSRGLHVGGLDYVKDFGSLSCGDRIIIVKVNPEHSVSVPEDYNHQKLRVCEYYVVGEYKGEMDKSPLYTSDAAPYGYDEDTEDMDDFGDDWEDEDYDDEDDYRDDDESDSWETFNDNSYYNPVQPKCDKPSCCNFHNVRDANGRFTKKK